MTSKWGKRLLSLGAVALGILADYLTKLLAVARLKGEDPVPFLRGVLRFSYVENPGAAWGMLANHRWVFMVFSAVAIAAIVVYLVRRDPPLLLCVSLSLILSFSLLYVSGAGFYFTVFCLFSLLSHPL